MQTDSAFDEYQRFTRTTATYPVYGPSATTGQPNASNLVYPALGLAEEAGEVAGKVKKAIRDEAGFISPERKEALKLELGDVLWYVARCADELGIPLSDIASTNTEKLKSRKARNALGGSGDKR